MWGRKAPALCRQVKVYLRRCPLAVPGLTGERVWAVAAFPASVLRCEGFGLDEPLQCDDHVNQPIKGVGISPGYVLLAGGLLCLGDHIEAEPGFLVNAHPVGEEVAGGLQVGRPCTCRLSH